MKKRIISAALASLMAVSALSTAAFADVVKADQTVTSSGVTAIPTLKVTMPKSMAFVINPYKLKVNISGKADEAGKNTTVVKSYDFGTDGGWLILNQSNIKINAKVYGVYKLGNTDTTKFELTQVAEATDASEGKKKVNLYVTGKVGTGEAKQIKLSDAAPEAWTDTTKVTTFENIPALDGENPGILTIMLAGDTKAHATADPWTDKDKVDVTYGFKFDFVANS